jgi:ABC-type lipoprotein release transport system permease subunit
MSHLHIHAPGHFRHDGLATALGALAGIAPAFRAARLDPVTAPRAQ